MGRGVGAEAEESNFCTRADEQRAELVCVAK